jgi:hypothetical protein
MFFLLLLLKTRMRAQINAQRENIRQEFNWQVLYGRRKRELVQVVAAEHCLKKRVGYTIIYSIEIFKTNLEPIHGIEKRPYFISVTVIC